MGKKIRNFFRCLPWLALLTSPIRAAAHQVDECLQAVLVAVEPGKIRLQMNLTPGTAVAGKMLDLIDRNHDGVISSNEAVTYAELLRRNLVARLDGRDLELKTEAVNFPELEELRTGWGIIQVEYSAAVAVLASGPHQFSLENRHQPVPSVYLFNAAVPETPYLKITGQKRNQNQSSGEIAFDFAPPANSLGSAVMISCSAVFVLLAGGIWWLQRNKMPACK